MKPLVSPDLEQYAASHTSPEPALLAELRAATAATMALPQMQVGLVEGSFLKMLVALTSARRVVEVGMFTGYSALMMASALPADGRLFTCDVDPEAEAMARSFFARSAHGEKIEIVMGPARETLPRIPGPVDLVFIDGSHTADYVRNDSEVAFRLVTARGLIVWHDYSPEWPGVVSTLESLAAQGNMKITHILGTTLCVYHKAHAP